MRVRIRAGFLPIRSASMPHMIPPKVWPIKKMAVMIAVYVVMTHTGCFYAAFCFFKLGKKKVTNPSSGI